MVSPERFGLAEIPTGAARHADQGICFGAVGDFGGLGVPLEFPAQADGEVSQVGELCEFGSVVEV